MLLTLTLATALAAQPVTIQVDPDRAYQEIEGWGTCLVSWVPQMREMYRTEAFQRVYVEEMGFNILRINMWGPVFPNAVEDPADISWRDFDADATDGRASIFLEFAQGARRFDPDFKVIGTVWSPPAWMKHNKSIVDTTDAPAIRGHQGYGDSGNHVERRYYEHFVRWMAEYVKWFEFAGVPFHAVSPGNEIQFNQSFESNVWTAPDFAEIVAMTGETFEEEGLGHVKLFGPETMTGHFYEGGTGTYIDALMENPRSREQLDVIATHGYTDGVEADLSENSSRLLWDYMKDTGKPLWITEGGTGGHDWPTPVTGGVATGIHNAMVAGNVSAWVPWQISDPRENTHGLMVGERMTPKTYATMQYTRFVEPGAVRVDATPAYGDLLVSAYRHNEEGVVVVVAINPSDSSETLALDFGDFPIGAYRAIVSSDGDYLTDVAMSGPSLAMPGHSIATVIARFAG